MPSIRVRVAATTANALATSKFAILKGPVILNAWAAGVTATDDIGLSIDNTEIIAQGTDINIEASADVIDIDRDQIIFNELIGAGQLYMPMTVTTEAQVLLSLKPL